MIANMTVSCQTLGDLRESGRSTDDHPEEFLMTTPTTTPRTSLMTTPTTSLMTRTTTMNGNTPRARRTRAASLLVVLAFAGVALSGCQNPVEQTNVTDVNEVRAAVVLPELVRSAELDVKARAQADRMARRGTIFHSTNLATGVSGGWTSIGENVAMAGSLEQAQAALEASPPHYANMTDRAFNQVGVGVVTRNGVVYVVQVFVGR